MMTDEEKRELLYSQLLNRLKGQESAEARASEVLGQSSFNSALAKAAAQAGTLGGKMADTSAVDASQQALQSGIKSTLADTAGVDLRRKLYADLTSKIQKDQELAQKSDLESKRLAADALQKREMMAPKWTSTGKTDDQNRLILMSQYGDTKFGPQVAAKTPEESQKEKTKKEETLYRYNSLQSNAAKLKSLIADYGTFEALGPQSEQMDSLIYQMAVDFAKLVDPESVAREGEVAAAQKYMLNVKGLGVSNATALKLIENYKQDLDQRLASRSAARRGEEYVHSPAMAPRDGQAIAAPPVYKDGDVKTVGGVTYTRQGGVWRKTK